MASHQRSGSIAEGPPDVSRELPAEVSNCLENTRFLHLATCKDNTPHVSVMNYTYLPQTPYTDCPTIIMTSLPASHKTADLSANPKVSVVVHDWVSARPPTLASGHDDSAGRSSLANLLFGLNSASMSRISVSLNGLAELLPAGSEAETWCKAKHKEHNTFDENSNGGGGLLGGASGAQEDGGATAYIEGQDTRVIVVRITDGRISDWKGSVKDWVLASDNQSATRGLVNGV